MTSGSGSRAARSPVPAGAPAVRAGVGLRSKPARLAGFGCLYVSFAATLGFLGSAAPLVLRQRGVALAEVGLLQLIYLPLGLTFLWAPALDRLRLGRLPHRLGWVAAMQALGVAALIALMAGEGCPAAALFALALLVSFGFATTDASLEALVVETVAAADRPAVTTAKLAGSAVGGLVGTGLLVIGYHRLGWSGSFLALALLDAVSLLPILFYPERSLRHATGGLLDAAGRPLDAAGSLPRRRRPGRPSRALAGRALLLGLYFGSGSAAASGYALALQDLGLSLPAIGSLIGTVGPAVSLVGTLLVGALMSGAAPLGGRPVSAERLVALFTVGVALGGLALAVAAAAASASLAAAAVVVSLVSSAGLGVPVFNVLYRWSEGASAATDYSLLFGIGFLAAMPARVGGPAFAAALGWPLFFVVATAATVGALVLIVRAMRAAGDHHCAGLSPTEAAP